MSFSDENAIVDNSFSLKSHNLKGSCSVKSHRSSSGNTSDLLEETTQEGVTGTGEGVEGDSVLELFNGSTIEESEVTIILPLGSLEKGFVLTLEHSHEVFIVDGFSSVSSHSLLAVKLVSRELLLEDLGVGIVSLLRSASVSVTSGISKNDLFSLK